MEIRKPTLADIDSLSVLFDEYRMFYGKLSDVAAAKSFLSERIIRKESEIFIAVENGVMMGFVQLYPLFSSTRLKRLWLLNDLYVEKKFRGRGISKKLIEESKKLCHETNACAMTLETSKGNDIGNKLYPASGFVLDAGNNFYEWEMPV